MRSKALAAIVFVVGCMTGGVASQMVIPKARAGTTPPRWDYFCKEAEDSVPLAEMNKSGAEGWELVSVSTAKFEHKFNNDYEAATTVYCFKRPAP